MFLENKERFPLQTRFVFFVDLLNLDFLLLIIAYCKEE